MLDSSGNVETFKLKNIYDSIEQAKTEMRTEMKTHVDKRGKYWADWAKGQLQPSINAKIAESTANSKFVHKGVRYWLRAPDFGNREIGTKGCDKKGRHKDQTAWCDRNRGGIQITMN